MPIPTPFHDRTASLCRSYLWKEWAGFHAVRSFENCLEREYQAVRQAAGLIDVSPLHKLEIRGRDAGRLLSQTTVRDARKLRPGHVTYLCWCDDHGHVVDDGTLTCLDREHFRLTSNASNLAWFGERSRGLDLSIEDSTESCAALAIQGPRSRAILENCAGGSIGALRYFRHCRTSVAGFAVEISRTGYTGDLGYEIWTQRDHALDLWDAVIEAGRPHRIEPVGLDALDILRIEAGYVLNGVDYFDARTCFIPSRKSTPDEIGLGWTIELERGVFTGCAAILHERSLAPRWRFVGLQLDWDEFEALHVNAGLPPAVPLHAWRNAVPVFDRDGGQVGQATSGAWSPILKSNLALATVEARLAKPGTELRVEVTVEYTRQSVKAIVRPLPFFDPPRKRN